ncbi:MAG: HAMP domain-containing sensor histidine kinase [Spirochaetales bacterium]|nr:HAMP domain-containing sensor histidine kinase [Spirochaetales bacterium]
MKISLTARLIIIMVLSVFLSSLVSILFVGSVTMNKVRLLNSQRDSNIASVVADSLTAAADEGQLSQTLRAYNMRRSGPGMMEGRMNMMGERKPVLPLRPLVMSEGNELVPLIITDFEGRILQGEFRTAAEDKTVRKLDSEIYEQGIPWFSEGEIAGYVLAGNQAGQRETIGDIYQMTSLYQSILVFPIISALFATLLGIFLLRRVLRPLKSLQKGVQTIQQGRYDFRVEFPASKFGIQDDLTLLSQGFNEMADSLEASEEWKKQIISDTAHELRTPVSLILGNLEMILDGVYKADTPRMESLYRETQSLAGLVRNLQILASEESGSRRSELERFSITELVQSTASDYSTLALQKKIAITLEMEEELEMEGDPQKIKQVLVNLMANALRHTPETGRIFLSCKRERNYIIVDVEDSGEGIPEEFREKVFNRFFKIDKSRNSEGSGLGLSISKIIIENLGGSIEALSGREGGALFRISFPGK